MAYVPTTEDFDTATQAPSTSSGYTPSTADFDAAFQPEKPNDNSQQLLNFIGAKDQVTPFSSQFLSGIMDLPRGLGIRLAHALNQQVTPFLQPFDFEKKQEQNPSLGGELGRLSGRVAGISASPLGLIPGAQTLAGQVATNSAIGAGLNPLYEADKPAGQSSIKGAIISGGLSMLGTIPSLIGKTYDAYTAAPNIVSEAQNYMQPLSQEALNQAQKVQEVADRNGLNLTTPEMYGNTSAKINQQNVLSPKYPNVASQYYGIGNWFDNSAKDVLNTLGKDAPDNIDTAAVSKIQNDFKNDQKSVNDIYTNLSKTSKDNNYPVTYKNLQNKILDIRQELPTGLSDIPQTKTTLPDIHAQMRYKLTGQPAELPSEEYFPENKSIGFGNSQYTTMGSLLDNIDNKPPTSASMAINEIKQYNDGIANQYAQGNANNARNLARLKNAHLQDVIDSAPIDNPNLADSLVNANNQYRQFASKYFGQKDPDYAAMAPTSPYAVDISKYAKDLKSEPAGFVQQFTSRIKPGTNPINTISQLHDLVGDDPKIWNGVLYDYLGGNKNNVTSSVTPMIKNFNSMSDPIKYLMFKYAPDLRQKLDDMSTIANAYPEQLNNRIIPKTGFSTQQLLANQTQQNASNIASPALDAVSGNFGKSIKGLFSNLIGKKITAGEENLPADLYQYLNSRDAQGFYNSIGLQGLNDTNKNAFLQNMAESDSSSPLLRKKALQLLNPKKVKTISLPRINPQ